MSAKGRDNLTGLLSPYLRRQRFAASRPYIKGRVLDYGCGPGLLADAFGLTDFAGVEIDTDMLAIARAKHPHAILVTPDELGKLDGQAFDTVAALAIIEHLDDPAGFLRTLRGLLAPGGRIVLTTPNPALDWAHGVGGRLGIFAKESHDEHQSLMDRKGIEGFAREAGLEIVLFKRFLFGANQLAVLRSAAAA